MTNERPILFSAPMVLALLAGTKTQTRRVVKPQPQHRWNHMGGGVFCTGEHHRSQGCEGDVTIPCLYGKPGDTLYVKETWRYADFNEDGETRIRYKVDGAESPFLQVPDEWADRVTDTWADLSQPANYRIDNKAADRRWRSSMFMPRWASRITLLVKSVRVERLQSISAEDCIAEGLSTTLREHDAECDLREQYAKLWDSINRAKHPWSSNPWVFVVSFERVKGGAA